MPPKETHKNPGRIEGQRSEGERKAAMLDEIRQFTQHPSLIKLMRSFGYIPPHEELDLGGKLAAQKIFTNDSWDFRKGKQRQEVKKQEFTPEQTEAIMETAHELGMVEAIKPKKSKYDVAVIAGGGGMHPLWRTRYLQKCAVEVKKTYLLGSENEFIKTDPQYKTYAPDAITEFDLMSRAAETVYGLSPEDGQTDHHTADEDWKTRKYPSSDLYVLSAPSSEPSLRRANTADSYRFLSKFIFDPAIEDVLVVTGSNFRTFQHFDALRMLGLPLGKNIETIGLDTRETNYHHPQDYLQEINSTINSAYDLYQEIRNNELGIRKLEGRFTLDETSLKYTCLIPKEVKGAVLLLHGAGSAKGKGRKLFEELQGRLAEAGFASFAHDEIGVGESGGDFSNSTLQNRLLAAERAADTFSVFLPSDTRVSLLGLSMGGHTAARLVGEEPDKFKSLILINAAAYVPEAEDKKLKPSDEFTNVLHSTTNWDSSLAFAGVRRFTNPVLMANSENDTVIKPEVIKGYKDAIPNLQKAVPLPNVQHAIFSQNTRETQNAKIILYDEIIDFLRNA